MLLETVLELLLTMLAAVLLLLLMLFQPHLTWSKSRQEEVSANEPDAKRVAVITVGCAEGYIDIGNGTCVKLGEDGKGGGKGKPPQVPYVAK